jgi:hypothetical protein
LRAMVSQEEAARNRLAQMEEWAAELAKLKQQMNGEEEDAGSSEETESSEEEIDEEALHEQQRLAEIEAPKLLRVFLLARLEAVAELAARLARRGAVGVIVLQLTRLALHHRTAGRRLGTEGHAVLD